MEEAGSEGQGLSKPKAQALAAAVLGGEQQQALLLGLHCCLWTARGELLWQQGACQGLARDPGDPAELRRESQVVP